MKLALLSFTLKGASLNTRLIKALKPLESIGEVKGYHLSRYEAPDLIKVETSLKAWTKEAFDTCEGIVYIGATGIAVRAIAPFIVSKEKDPAIVVIDELGQHIIPLLSGHLGGANNLARQLASLIQGKAIISTATDLEGYFAVDEWAKTHQLVLKELKRAKSLSAALIQGETIGVASPFPIKGDLPKGLEVLSGTVLPKGLCVGLNAQENPFEETLHLIPPILTLGIGCKKGTPFEKIEVLVKEALEGINVSLDAVKQVCSIDLKQEEAGLIEWAKRYDKPIYFYSSEALNAVEGVFTTSEFVKKVTHVDNVCERAAVKGSNGGKLILKKTVREGVTLAIAQAAFEVRL